MTHAGASDGQSPSAKIRARDAGRRVVESCLGGLLRSVDAHLCVPGQLPRHGIRRVLVLRPNHRIGNAVLTSPLLDEIEAIFPGAKIDMVSAGNAARALFPTPSQVGRMICLPRRVVRHLPASAMCLRELRATRYDLAIDPCVASNSAHLLLGACRARYKVGFAYSRSSDTAPAHDRELPDHVAKRGVYVLRRALGETTRTQWPALDVRLTQTEREQGWHALESALGHPGDTTRQRPILGLFANATGSKRLPEAWWGMLVARLREIRPDLCIVEILTEHGRSQLPDAVASFHTPDLRKLATALANMQGFVSADCGVMHLAAAVGTPTLGLFVRGNRAKYTPYGNHNRGLDVFVDDVRDRSDGAGVTHLAVMAWIRQAIAADIDADPRAPAGRDAPTGMPP